MERICILQKTACQNEAKAFHSEAVAGAAATSGKFGIFAASRAEVRAGMQNLLPLARDR